MILALLFQQPPRDLVENLSTADVILNAVKDLTQFSAFVRVYQTLRSAQGDKLGFSSGLLEDHTERGASRPKSGTRSD